MRGTGPLGVRPSHMPVCASLKAMRVTARPDRGRQVQLGCMAQRCSPLFQRAYVVASAVSQRKPSYNTFSTPLGLVALYWLRLYKPLLAANLATSIEKKVAKESAGKRAAFRVMKGASLMLQHVAPKIGRTFARRFLFRSVLDKMLGGDVECIILGGSHTPGEQMKTLSALGYFTVSGFGMTETAALNIVNTRGIHRGR